MSAGPSPAPVPGAVCTVCGQRFTASFDQILTGVVRCHSCGTEWRVEAEQNPQLMEALQELRQRLASIQRP
jgi:DNA-directed RNA polymerase subunit RPC12/RpoP